MANSSSASPANPSSAVPRNAPVCSFMAAPPSPFPKSPDVTVSPVVVTIPSSSSVSKTRLKKPRNPEPLFCLPPPCLPRLPQSPSAPKPITRLRHLKHPNPKSQTPKLSTPKNQNLNPNPPETLASSSSPATAIALLPESPGPVRRILPGESGNAINVEHPPDFGVISSTMGAVGNPSLRRYKRLREMALSSDVKRARARKSDTSSSVPQPIDTSEFDDSSDKTFDEDLTESDSSSASLIDEFAKIGDQSSLVPDICAGNSSGPNVPTDVFVNVAENVSPDVAAPKIAINKYPT